MTRSVAVIGGGPAGLYAARLLKINNPNLEVVVHERMAGAEQTFGFGVGLTESTMRNLESADPATAAAVRAASYVGHELHLRGADGTVPLHGARNLAIGRAALLSILGAAAVDVGVEIRRGVKADVGSTDADVVVAADGVASSTREKFAAEFGVRSSLGRSRFVWCGADDAVDAAFFTAVQRGDGLFVAHAYPYAPDRSTFLIEVDDTTWEAAGLAELSGRSLPGQTDEASVALLQDTFAELLGGGRLLANRTRWSRFTDLSLDRWSVDNVVLIGDAAHTAHYTLGSGTKLALEDAIALANALAGESSVPAAFAAYEQARRPPVDRFKKLAHRSQAWWDTYRHRHGWPADLLALSYMTRSGNLTLRNYAQDQPDVAGRAVCWLGDAAPTGAAELEDWVLGRPFRRRGLQLPDRTIGRQALQDLAPVEEIAWSEPDVWGERADAVVSRLTAAVDGPVLFTGPPSPVEVGARIDLAERVRMQTDRPVAVQLPSADRPLAATVVAAGRADLVVPS